VNVHEPRPEGTYQRNNKVVKSDAKGDVSSDSARKKDEHPLSKWTKRILAAAGAIVTIGGAVTVISKTTHWLDGITVPRPAKTAGMVNEIERSPILGISFYQNGQLDPMSYGGFGAGGGTNPVVTVYMTHAPFEIWFPALANGAALQVCAWSSDYIFQNAAQAGQIGTKSCMNPFNSPADYPYGGGGLWLSPPGNVGNTAIVQTRAQPASGGDEKYYVSNLANTKGDFYLAIYLNDNGFGNLESNGQQNSDFQASNLEDFILNFG